MAMGAKFRKTEIMGTAKCLIARVEEYTMIAKRAEFGSISIADLKSKNGKG